MKISIFVMKFLFIGALFIISNNNIYLSEEHGLTEFFGLFYSWLGNLFVHMKEITGYVVDSEWLPGNTGLASFLYSSLQN